MATEEGKGALFLFDELQFMDGEVLGLIAAAFHQLGQRNAPVVLAAAGLPQLPLLLHHAKPYAERLFSYRQIGSLPPPAARAAFTIPAERADARFNEDALGMLREKTEGYPYLIQQRGESVWGLAEDDVITLADVTDAEPSVQEDLDGRFFRDRYDKATEAERIYMAAMADLGGGPTRRAGSPHT